MTFREEINTFGEGTIMRKAEISIIISEYLSGAAVNSFFAEMLCIYNMIFDKYQPLRDRQRKVNTQKRKKIVNDNSFIA